MNTVRKKVIVSTVAGTLAVSVAFVNLFGEKLNLKRESEYDNTQITSSLDVEDEITTTKPSVVEESSSVVTYIDSDLIDEVIDNKTDQDDYKKNDEKKDDTYYLYLNIINKIIEEKKLTGDIKDLILKSYDLIYHNYDDVASIYKQSNIPEKEEFLNKYVNGLKSINEYEINYVDDEVGTACYLPNSKKITINISKNNRIEFSLIEQVTHEVNHSIQDDNNFLSSSKRHKLQFTNPGLFYILVEGDSNLISTCLDDCTAHNGYLFANKGNESLCLKGKNYDKRYSLLYKFNSMYMHLTDYDTLINLRETMDVEGLVQQINEKYKIDSSKFIDLTLKMSKNIYNNNYYDGIYDDLNYIDSFYLNCLEKEAKSISTPDEAMSFLNYCRYYLLQEQSVYINYDLDDIYSKAEEYYNIDKFKGTLYDMLSNNDISINKQVFDSLLSLENQHSLMCKLSLDDSKIVYDNDDYTIIYGKYAITYYKDGTYLYLDNPDQIENIDEAENIFSTNAKIRL